MDEIRQKLEATVKRLEDENRILRFEVEKLEAHKQKYEGTDRARLLTRLHRLERLLADALIELADAREAKTASAA
jgi:hypothetical protein